jgi:hypothetical protein
MKNSIFHGLCLLTSLACSGLAHAQNPAPLPTETAQPTVDTDTPQFRGIDREGKPIFTVEKPEAKALQHRPQDLVEEFTALTLSAGELKIGTELEYGLSDRFMVGFDMLSTLVGAPTFQAKYFALERGPHRFALGMRAAFIDRDTILWGSAKDHFDELEARYFRPALAWTNQFSPRLRIHTYLAQGFGSFNARLSPEGRKKLWEAKHPGGDYETRNTNTEPGGLDPDDPTADQAQRTTNRNDSYAQRSLQVSSVTGIMADSFQMTGEFNRITGHKILITTRIERMELERLKANGIRLTAAQQWVWEHFQMRLGIGLQYVVISGRDLDGERIDEAGLLPASDIRFYWRL